MVPLYVRSAGVRQATIPALYTAATITIPHNCHNGQSILYVPRDFTGAKAGNRQYSTGTKEERRRYERVVHGRIIQTIPAGKDVRVNGFLQIPLRKDDLDLVDHMA